MSLDTGKVLAVVSPQARICGADRTGEGSAADDLWTEEREKRPRSLTDHYPNTRAHAFANLTRIVYSLRKCAM